ncbi:MAG: hypothetical protein PVS3B3_18960 [Ktedonobacteraceae bacterium]
MTDLTPHYHQARNVNYLHRAEIAAGSFNQKLAIKLTQAVGTMACAYFFAMLAIIGWPGPAATATQWVQWISQTLIQLVMLSVIMVGQSLQNRHQELQADEQFKMTQKICHDNAVIIALLQQKASEVPHD